MASPTEPASRHGRDVLTEDDVIDAVRDFLFERGWELVSRATAIQRGEDLVMEAHAERLIIEAKGAGSSKLGTARYGNVFNKRQVFDHVGKAILKALRVASSGEAVAGVALPDNADHRHEIDLVRPALHRAGIIVFWVAEDRTTRVDAADGRLLF